LSILDPTMLGQDLSDIDLRDVGLVLFYYLIKLQQLMSIVIPY
jgi:hypothetical protein